MAITGTTVYRDDLTRIYSEYSPTSGSFVARKLFPLVPVDAQAGRITVVTRESMLNAADIRRTGPEGGYNIINMKTGQMLYACEDRGLMHPIPRASQTPPGYDAFVNGTLALKTKMVMATENIVAGICCDTSVFTGSTLYLDVTTAWSSAASVPISDVGTGCAYVQSKTGVRPNTLTLNAKYYEYLLSNTSILARIGTGNSAPRNVVEAALPGILGVKQVLVSDAIYNSAVATPDAFTAAGIWSDSYAFLSVCAMPGDPLETPCIGRTPIWTPDGTDTVIETLYDEKPRVDYVRARENVTELLIDSAFGFLLKID